MKTLESRVHEAYEWVLERLPARLRARVEKASGGRFGLGSQIVVGLGGGAFLTLGGCLLALAIMAYLNARQGEITDRHIPALAAAFQIERSSAQLVGASPRLLTAVTEEELDAVQDDVLREEELLQGAIAEIARAEAQGQAGLSLVPLSQSLVENIEQILDFVTNRIEYRSRLAELQDELEQFGPNAARFLEEELDDQQFFIDVGLRRLTDARPVPVAQRTSQAERDHERGLLEFRTSQSAVRELATQAIAETDLDLLASNRERVDTEFARIEHALSKMRSGVADGLRTSAGRLRELYDDVLETKSRELDELNRSEEYVARNQQTTGELGTLVDELVAGASLQARTAADDSSALTRLGTWLVLGVSVMALVSAFTIGWKFFGERLLARVRHLSNAMSEMSKGDLEVEVKIAGNDEVTDMAGSLEVFRQHAVEVQRLNLVEKLAGEVQAKNAELESTLEDLKRTQQQVVSQEKLAALGTLTAGIAHEIRNPLNFVNNFAALSVELIDELREELGVESEDGGDAPASENGAGSADSGPSEGGGPSEGSGSSEGNGAPDGLDKEYLEEILGDLSLNVTKVREHGVRANRIVEGMLAHSRDDAGVAESVDVNLMLDEYSKLAYHGLRAADSTFNLTIERDFDEAAGEVVAIARDLSRVFLNVITNGCQATDARRKKEQDSGYSPAVRLKTKGMDDSVLISVRDNGTGIPPSVVEKIFDPFFTTKTGTQGTGLGLSISREIVQEHGGEMRVETEEGEYTEFLITLPRKAMEAGSAGTADD